MDEKPPVKPWKQPLHGRGKLFAWFALFVVVALVAFWIITISSGPSASRGQTLLFSTLAAIALATFGLGAVWLIRWLASWRNIRRFLFGAVCVVTLIALVYVEENLRGKAAWSKHRRELEAKGEKMSIADLIPPPVPDEKNFALTPLLKPLYEFTPGTGSVVWSDTNGLARLQAIGAEIADARKTNQLKMGSLEKETFADIQVSADFYKGNTNYPQAAEGAVPAEVMLAALRKFDPEIKELREAAATRPYSRFPIQYDYQPCWAILLPHLAHIKGLTRLMGVRATAELAAKRPAEAWEDLQLGFRLSDSIREEPLLIDHLVRIATVAINLQTIREGLFRRAWTEEQLARLQVQLAKIDLLAEYKLAMRGERAFGTTGLDFIRRERWSGNPMMYLANENGGSHQATVFPMLPGGIIYQNMVAISAAHQEFNLASVDEQTHRVFPEISEKGTRFQQETPMSPYNFLMKMLMPALEKAARKSANMQVYADSAQVACALERYRLAKGEFPELLDALTPDLIRQIPTDVIDGKTLRYRRDAEGSYRLYSIGWNQKDDGGEPSIKKGKDGSRESVDVTQGDWVWQMSAR